MMSSCPLLYPQKLKKPLKANTNKGYKFYLVPRTGFEPAHPCERCDLNTVRLPISPPGQVNRSNDFKTFNFSGLQMYSQNCF